ncbi:MAG TPA: hypothetical protein VL947_01075, partial [Cytophagales bacterium]|nr:hypothetical protein [Cytophagales bacterium]
MNSKLLLRIAAGSIFVHLLGHTMGHLTWKTPEDNQIKEVVTQMLTHKATFMGATRSMGDYFEGYSLILFFVYGMSIALLWLISSLSSENPAIA